MRRAEHASKSSLTELPDRRLATTRDSSRPVKCKGVTRFELFAGLWN
jgi:hypothetical protein